jgi:hypothetical protein
VLADDNTGVRSWRLRPRQPLAKLGVPTVAVALPSRGEIGDTLGDLYDDVEACH